MNSNHHSAHDTPEPSASGTPTTEPAPTATDVGQATAEYALVLLGAAAIALILLGWATGSGSGRIGGLLDQVISAITGNAK